jgi:SAM-dependent methyltransferase
MAPQSTADKTSNRRHRICIMLLPTESSCKNTQVYFARTNLSLKQAKAWKFMLIDARPQDSEIAELSSNKEWKQWGKDDPLWSVANWANKQRGTSSSWTPEELYAVGESDWQDFSRQWMQYGFDRRSCLEIGCGAGRITKPLARTFDRVFAVDVSEEMLQLARKAVGSNVQFSLIDGLHLPQAEGSVSSVFSTHVIQHVDTKEIGYAYFREFYRVLEKGGTIMVHLPLYMFPRDSKVERLLDGIYAVFRWVNGKRATLKRAANIKIMRWTSYPIDGLTRVLTELGFRDIEFRTMSVASNGAAYTFVLARK